eukprot:5519608-Prymnesium_polylepis.1
MLTEVLGGSRCRAVPPMAAAEMAYPAFRRPLHSFSNASRAAAAQPDWKVIKGFAVYQCDTPGSNPRPCDSDQICSALLTEAWQPDCATRAGLTCRRTTARRRRSSRSAT